MSIPAAGPARALTIRKAEARDAEACGRICFDAFKTIGEKHGFPAGLASPEMGIHLLSWMFSHPGMYCVVAELDGRAVGSNCLDERSTIAGIGPITVDPAVQDRRIGYELMQAVMERARERKFPGVRLLQAAFHCRSMSLYAKLGFVVREPVAVMQGSKIQARMDGCTVRTAEAGDIEACNRVCFGVHGHDRGGELADVVKRGSAVVVERAGRITGYSTGTAFFGHTAAESNHDLKAILVAADSFGGPGIIVPTRNAELFRWCLDNGLRMVEPMTVMTVGLYNEPVGAYLPSVLY